MRDLLKKHSCGLGCDYAVFEEGQIVLVHVLEDLLVHELYGSRFKIGHFRYFRFLNDTLLVIVCFLIFFVTLH